MLSRRSMLGASAAVVAVSAIPLASYAAPSDFALWEREARAIDDRIELCTTDEEVDALSDERWDYEQLIAKTPARTREDMLVKVRLLKHDRAADLDPAGVDMADQIIAFLGGLN